MVVITQNIQKSQPTEDKSKRHENNKAVDNLPVPVFIMLNKNTYGAKKGEANQKQQ